MRPTTILKASDLQTAVARANQWHSLWRTEHFANGEHNSRLIPVTVMEVDATGAVVAQISIMAGGASYSATALKVATGRYLITLDADILIETANASVFHSASSQAQVDAITANTIDVRTYAVSSAGALTPTDMGFFCDIYAAKFSDTGPAALTTAFAPGGFPESARVEAIIEAQNDTHDLMLTRHGFEGVHTDRRNPMALGRIVYSGGAYSVAPGSIGINSATKLSAGRCAVEFNVTAPLHWVARYTPLSAAAYPYTSARTTTGVVVELFSTITKPVYALRDGDFFIAGWAL